MLLLLWTFAHRADEAGGKTHVCHGFTLKLRFHPGHSGILTSVQ